MAKRKPKPLTIIATRDYDGLLSGVSGLLDQARAATARVVNGVMTATYFELGRRIVEFEQGGKERAEYGEELLKRLGADLSKRFGRGFGWRNLFSMRAFYLGWGDCPDIIWTIPTSDQTFPRGEIADSVCNFRRALLALFLSPPLVALRPFDDRAQSRRPAVLRRGSH